MNNRTGTIQVGNEADFVLLNKNPLEEIGNTRKIAGVACGGRWYDTDELAKLLRDAAAELGR